MDIRVVDSVLPFHYWQLDRSTDILFSSIVIKSMELIYCNLMLEQIVFILVTNIISASVEYLPLVWHTYIHYIL